MSGGLFSDHLLRRTGSANVARKLPIIAGLLLASTIVVANFVSQDALESFVQRAHRVPVAGNGNDYAHIGGS